jgi:hypothetical protein
MTSGGRATSLLVVVPQIVDNVCEGALVACLCVVDHTGARE